jgi:uncharacterized membrane protein
MLMKEELKMEKINNILKKDWAILILIILGFVFGIYFYPSLPNRIPILWNLKGEVNGYGSKFYGAFGIPLLNLGIYLLFLVLPYFALPYTRRKNYALFQSTYQYLKYLLIIFLLGMEVTTFLTATGVAVNMSVFIRIFASFLVLLIGNVVMRFKR